MKWGSKGSSPLKSANKERRCVMVKKKKVVVPEVKVEQKKVYIEYDSHQSGGEPESDEEWSCHSDTVITVNFKRLHREPPANRFFYDSIDLPHDGMLKMDHLWLAVIRYSSGDTFGHSTGHWHIVGIAPTYEIAQLMIDEEIKPSTPGKYKCWEGYFESLEDTEIHELRLV